MNNDTFVSVLKSLFLFGVAFAVIIGVSLAIKSIVKNSDEPNPLSIRQVVECPNDYGSYEKIPEQNRVTVLADKSSYAQNGSVQKEYTVTLKRNSLKSQIACGYLFYKVSDGDRPIQQQYENLVMSPINGQFGGHILPDNHTWIRNEDVNGKTEILLPLNEIQYDGTTRTNIKFADWSSLLNVSDQIDFRINLNTEDTRGHIDLIQIAYKCWNPKTGEPSEDCKLEAIEK